MTTLILQGATLNNEKAEALAKQLGATLCVQTDHFELHTEQVINSDQISTLRAQHDFDINCRPQNLDINQIKLLVTDMDSTLISIECIDEIADFLNIKTKISSITESAMRGEIDFETSLNQRIELLEGLKTEALQQVYDQRLTLNPGAEKMIAGLQRNNIKVALVSGGFTFFTERLKDRLNLDYTLANELAFSEGKLIGLGNSVIVGAQRKAEFLLQLCNELNISPQQTVAMGDGANDLVMMREAGLSIAYHAKPTVQEQASTALNHCGLEGVLGLLEIN